MCRCELEAAIDADMEAAGIAESDDTCERITAHRFLDNAQQYKQ